MHAYEKYIFIGFNYKQDKVYDNWKYNLDRKWNYRVNIYTHLYEYTMYIKQGMTSQKLSLMR